MPRNEKAVTITIEQKEDGLHTYFDVGTEASDATLVMSGLFKLLVSKPELMLVAAEAISASVGTTKETRH